VCVRMCVCIRMCVCVCLCVDAPRRKIVGPVLGPLSVLLAPDSAACNMPPVSAAVCVCVCIVCVREIVCE
jgi:hypothetical protein